MKNIKYKPKFQKALIDIEKAGIKKGDICEVSSYYNNGNLQLLEYNYQHDKNNFKPSTEKKFLKQKFVSKADL